MEYGKAEISVPAPEFGAIFMSNIATKRLCFKHKVFGLPSSMANFVKEVKKGMVLFLFEYERRLLFGVYRAVSDGEMNIMPHAFSSSGKQFSAQVRFMPIWDCSPLSENEFRDAIRENYFSPKKFHFGLSDEQVHRLLSLFSSRKLNDKLPPRNLTTRVENEDKVESAEHVYYSDKKRRIGYDEFIKKRIGYDEMLLRDNAAEVKRHVHSHAGELGFSGEDGSFSDRVKSEHEYNPDYIPLFSSYMVDSDIRRTADDAKLVMRDQIINENNMDSSYCLDRSNFRHGKLSDGDRIRPGTHYSGFLRNNSVDKAHNMDNSHEPALSRRNRSDYISDSTVVSERFVNSPYNLRTVAEGTAYSPMKKTSGYSTEFIAETEFPHSTKAQNLGPSISKYHDATITRAMPYKREFPGSFYGHSSTYEVEHGSNFVQKHSSYDVNRENNFASFKGIYPEFTKRGLEPRRSHSPNTSWLLHQGNNLTNLDCTNSPGANDEHVGSVKTGVLHSDSRNSRRSVFSRLSSAPKVRMLREQEDDQSMSYDEYIVDSTVDEIMDMLYEEQNIVPKKPFNRKPFVRRVGYGTTKRSSNNDAVVKNDVDQHDDLMKKVHTKDANEALEEAVNHVLAETRVVDFKRRRETNQASEETNGKFTKEKTSANEHTVVENAQGNSSEAAGATDPADKPSKSRKLVRPVFNEKNSTRDLNQ